MGEKGIGGEWKDETQGGTERKERKREELKRSENGIREGKESCEDTKRGRGVDVTKMEKGDQDDSE
ncbi:hypothetical protein E2C01_096790 [Portunus trituberculatus]|uniref:Uncharacterized protein n=1 Tax=Portunus trituberculatus TaxID=210409 RepID=A0A5B7JWI5_PORTR|nr:hypothetical protein [Portunus trituberculatus]